MLMAGTVSIVIPTLNSPTIAEVVKAVEAQVPVDRSVEIVVSGLDERGLVPSSARLVTTGQPLGISAARNLGVRESSGDYVLFLDSDCIPQPGWLDVLISQVQGDRVAVSAAIKIVSDHYVRLAGNVASFHEFTSALPSSKRPYLATFSLAVPRDCFEQIGWFDESLSRGEDLDFTIRLRKAGYTLWFDSRAVVIHRPTRTSVLSLMRHAYQSGANSIRVRQRYPDAFGMPRWLLHWERLLICSPALACGATSRALLRNPDVRRHWRTLPLMLLSRLTWCLGACATIQRTRHSAM